MRMPGIGTEMIRRLGAVPTLMPPGDLFPALQAGTLDATDFTGPANDMALGFHQVCKFVYWPGIQKPGAVQQVIISKAKYDALPKSTQEIVKVACQAAHQDMLADYNWINAKATKALKEQHDVKFLTLSDELLIALGNSAGQLLVEEREKLDPLGKKIWDSYFKARADQMALTDGADQRSLQCPQAELQISDVSEAAAFRMIAIGRPFEVNAANSVHSLPLKRRGLGWGSGCRTTPTRRPSVAPPPPFGGR